MLDFKIKKLFMLLTTMSFIPSLGLAQDDLFFSRSKRAFLFFEITQATMNLTTTTLPIRESMST